MRLKLSAPSKTYLVGEYLAMSGGSAVLLNTEPRFEMSVAPSAEGICEGISFEGPAGQFIRNNSDTFSNLHIKFVDPHEGLGGFGASGAQFLFVWAIHQMSLSGFVSWEKNISPLRLLADHDGFFDDKAEAKPSGYDMASQLAGSVSLISRSHGRYVPALWPFPEKAFYVVHLGRKVATHEHLQKLRIHSYATLSTIAEDTVSAFVDRDWPLFKRGITEYRDALAGLDLTCDETLQLYSVLKAAPEIEAFKGCGALGADTLVVFCDAAKKDLVYITLKEKLFVSFPKARIITSNRGLAAGLDVRFSHREPLVDLADLAQ